MSDGPLTGRVAVVTGASRRRAIGAAVARRLAADGASVFVHSWSAYDAQRSWGPDPGGVEALVEELQTGGARVGHAAADLAPGRPTPHPDHRRLTRTADANRITARHGVPQATALAESRSAAVVTLPDSAAPKTW